MLKKSRAHGWFSPAVLHAHAPADERDFPRMARPEVQLSERRSVNYRPSSGARVPRKALCVLTSGSGASRLLTSQTTSHTSPYTAVRLVEPVPTSMRRPTQQCEVGFGSSQASPRPLVQASGTMRAAGRSSGWPCVHVSLEQFGGPPSSACPLFPASDRRRRVRFSKRAGTEGVSHIPKLAIHLRR